jgi:phosphoglucomutase/phosphomannomutase
MDNSTSARVREAFSKLQVPETLRHKAEESLARWLKDAVFADARPQLLHAIEAGAFGQLFDAFFQEIPFGTGGRRGPVGFGPNRINPFTVATSIEGHSHFLRQKFPKAETLSVVVAFDVRVFNDLRGTYDGTKPNPLLGMTSKDFARIAAGVYASHGILVWMPDPSQDRYISTPELSFSIRHLQAHGGLNISASHNHPDDNGAKIYNDKGSQEIPPTDEELARIVEATRSATPLPFDEAVRRGLVKWLEPEVSAAYIEMNARVSRDLSARGAKVVFTPLHGTGFSSAGASLIRAGFQVDLFPDQASPDGTFPNVPFRSPNPEVPQSLRGAADYARDRGADLVLGTDPDADRLGMMAPHQGQWTFLNGNEIGTILAHYLFTRLRAGGPGPKPTPYAVTTIVTTSLFSRMARALGIRVVDDLGVGFKYIADVINQIEAKGSYRDIRSTTDGFVIGIEESHGYLVVPSIRDKDAAGAGVLLAEIASQLKVERKSFIDRLDDIYREFGCVRNFLVSTVMLGATGFSNMRKIQESLRKSPPAVVGGRKVLEALDRWSETGPLGRILSETDRMSRDLLTFRLEGDARIILRPSGTESKNKIYVEASGNPLGKGASAAALTAEMSRLAADAKRLGRAFTQEMLSRIDVRLPAHALEISDLVALENKLDFAEKLLPELVARFERGETVEDVGRWLDGRLKPYGADARMLVEPAIAAFVTSQQLAPAVASGLEELFHASVASRGR